MVLLLVDETPIRIRVVEALVGNDANLQLGQLLVVDVVQWTPLLFLERREFYHLELIR